MTHKKKKMYPGGGKLKKVNAAKQPGLAKLPTDVRNKMGYMAMGGKMDADKDFMYGGKMKKGMYGMKKTKYAMGGGMNYSAAAGQTVPQILKREKLTYGMGGKFLNQHD